MSSSRPSAEVRWLEKTLGEAATVTIVTGLTAAEVEPEFETDFFVVEIEDAVIVVENNHYVGSRDEVLERLSRNGKAASHYWNVNRLTRLSFARAGQVIALRAHGRGRVLRRRPGGRRAL